MNPIQSISSVFRNYINFSGRAQRPEYWWFALFSFGVSVILGLIAIGLPVLSFLEWVFSLAVLLPSLAVGARRLHDTNRTAWWLLLIFIPILGWIALLIFLVMPGTPGPNRYGPNPLQPQPGMGGYDYTPPGGPYAPPYAAGGYGGSPFDAALPDFTSAPDTGGRQFCTQCGAERQPEAQFCTVCGTAV